MATPVEAIELSFNRTKVDDVFSQTQYSAENLIALFRNGVTIKHQGRTLQIYNESVHVGSINLSEHSIAVLKRFDEFFAHKKLPAGLDINFFRVVLALHDIGKPIGGIYGQHEYTRAIMSDILRRLGYQDSQIKIAIVLVSKDPIGYWLRGESCYQYVEDAVADIVAMAKESGLALREFFELLLVFYVCDASSYDHLRHLFVYNRSVSPPEINLAQNPDNVIRVFRQVIDEVLAGRISP